MDKATAIDKIRKCMALSTSAEPYEAAAALRQAQKLMEQFQVDHAELLAAGVTEQWARSGATKVPPRWEVSLASLVARAFSCEIIFTRRLNSPCTAFLGGYAIIGAAPAPEVAAYTFKVLARQIKSARMRYMKVALKRHRKNRLAAADQFCAGWVTAVRGLIASVAPTAAQVQAIEAYARANYAETSKLVQSNRQLSGPRTSEHGAIGYIVGQQAQLHRGVAGAASGQLLLEAP